MMAVLRYVRRRKWRFIALAVSALPLVVFAARSVGPHRFYRVDLAVGPGTPGPDALHVGVAKRDITPDLSRYDTWTDSDGNGKFEPERGDTWEDVNGNGTFDAVWLAGFGNKRPATGVNDPLWARAIAFRGGGVTVAMVTIDSIGIFYNDFITVRKGLDPALEIDHVLFSTTHNHEAPDTMGLWSYRPFPSKFDHDYLARVRDACREAVEEAVRNLRPARATLAEKAVGPEGYVDDSRPPFVYDNILRCARFDDARTGDAIATLVVWGNHPETLGGSNTVITSDFPHWLRQGVEEGVPGARPVEGAGGMCLYFQGMVGGLMTQLHTAVPPRDDGPPLKEASFAKARALGHNLAEQVLGALRGPGAWRPEDTRVAVAAKTVFVPMEGLFELACALGLLHPGYFWGKGRTELNALRVGDIEILTTPGELYPEIGDGGIVALEGRDFHIEPVETPPLRDRMRGRMNLIVGLANDEIGYIIPRSQWDAEPPWVYGEKEYGEVNSCGPGVAPVLHAESLALLDRLHALLGETDLTAANADGLGQTP